MLFKIHFQKWSKVTQGLRYYFPENFRSNLKFYENKNLSVSSLHRIFESENLKFPFSTKMRSEMWKIKIQKIEGHLLDKLRKSVAWMERYST